MAEKFIQLVNTLFTKVLGENEKCSLVLPKAGQTFWSTQYKNERDQGFW